MTVQPVDAVLPLVRDALSRHRGPGPLVVAIDGRSGSGKTDLAAALVPALRTEPGVGDAVGLLALEEAYRGWNGLAVGLGAVASGVLEPLSRGLPGRVRRYDWHADRVSGWLDVPAPGTELPAVLVVEGCGAGSAICAPFVHVLVWLDTPAEVRRKRAMARDAGSWADRWESWARQERALLAARDARAAADLVIRG
ncbi:hypothetical protein [Georgenia alba]|uniref:Uridine kinase n=1 Tax=Georgenia alba TaxID=2233858 RepID=A0ABW2QFQ2_9MICO